MQFVSKVLRSLAVQLSAGMCFRFIVREQVRRNRFKRTVAEPDNKSIPTNVNELVESQWYTLIYGVLCAMGILALLETSQSWYDGEVLWARSDGTTAHSYNMDIVGHPTADLYLHFQVAFFLQELIALLFLAVPKKDWIVQAIHHVVTCIILSLSLLTGYHRVALLTLLFHDISDVFMWMAKMTKFSYEMFHSNRGNNDDDNNNSRFVTALFVVFAISFFYARFFLLPINVIWPTLRESLRLYRPTHAICTTGLLILQCLHFMWGYMILKIVYRKLWLGKDLKDVRKIDCRQQKNE